MQKLSGKEKLDPEVFDLLMKIKKQIWPPRNMADLGNSALIDYIAEQIRDVSDELGTPVFRENYRLWIYVGERRLEIGKNGFEEYLGWVSKHIGLDSDTAYHIPFRNQLFGACWRVLAPEK